MCYDCSWLESMMELEKENPKNYYVLGQSYYDYEQKLNKLKEYHKKNFHTFPKNKLYYY